MTLGEIIKQYRESFGLSMDAFSERSGISKTYVSLLEKNENPKTGKPIAPTIRVVKQCASAMNMDFNTLFGMIDGGVTVNDKFLSPVHDLVPAAIPFEMISDINEQNSNEYFGLEIHGDSMAPNICDGDIVIVHIQDDASSGDIVITTVGGKEATCSRLRKYASGLELIPNNPSCHPADFSDDQIQKMPVTIVGKVVELRRKF